MKKRWVIIIFLLSILFVCGIFVYINYIYNFDIRYHTISKIEIDKSKYHDSGSWWGYNQKKLATIDDVTFSFHYDNSALDNGNSSETNPFKCHFIIIKDDIPEVFGSGNANATCNVLTDSVRNKVYYVVNEPVGGPNSGGYAWTGPGRIVIYTYDYNPVLKSVTFNNKYNLLEPSDDGRQRMGSAINNQGKIIISYGSYNAMLNVFIFDPINNSWNSHQTLSNPDNDSLMYNYTIIKDLDEFYILGIQDTAKNGDLYYQYVKLLGYKGGVWIEEMVVDYRETAEAQNNANMVEHKEFKLIDDKIHIITKSDVLNEIKYFIWDNNELLEQDISFIRKDSYWIRLVNTEDDLLFIYNYSNMLGSNLEIYSSTDKSKVYCNRNFTDKAYIYVNVGDNDLIQVLGICGSQKDYNKSKAYIYEISKK